MVTTKHKPVEDMKTKFLTPMIVLSGLFLWGCNSAPKGTYQGKNEAVPFRVISFGLDQVQLLDGPFRHAMDLDLQTLLNYEPDRLLAKFRSEAGLEPRAAHYNGWEDATIAGHSLGHYLSAIAMAYKATGDERFIGRINYIVDELSLVQEANRNGYIGAFPNGKRIMEEEVAKGDIRSQGFDLNGIWVPWYTIHKDMAGLRDAYRLCGVQKALDVEKKLGDWTGMIISGLNDDQMQLMMRCEQGGISEVLADLSVDTGDARYMDMARKFHHKAIIDSLAKGVDILPNRHCNTNIPKVIGQARIYELTGDSASRRVAEFFWDRVVNHHTYVTGGNGNDEYFGKPDTLSKRLGQGTTESCNVYNMLKLTQHLFEWNAQPAVADFYERALFNHILSTMNPEDGRVVYNLSLKMGGYKEFQDPYDFTCCVGTGMENHVKYGENIYYHNDQELFVSQFIASELSWTDKGLKLVQTTRYPEEQGTTLDVTCNKPVKLALHIRCPYWAEQGAVIKVNGRKIPAKTTPSSFITISRNWKTGDKVDVSLPFSLRLEAMPDDSTRIAVMYGPLVLAGDLGPIDDPEAKSPVYVPVLLTESRNPSDWLKPVENKSNTFIMSGVGKPRDVELKPFYQTYIRRYSVFWDIFTGEAWDKKQAEYKLELARKAEIKARTIDFVQPGEMQPEREHNFKGEKTTPYMFQDRMYRESRGGWFSFDMKVLPDQPVIVNVEYWGGFPGSKTFDIMVGDTKIATQNISSIREGQWIDIDYPVPEELTRGKSKITVTFKAFYGHMAGPVFGVRTLKTN